MKISTSGSAEPQLGIKKKKANPNPGAPRARGWYSRGYLPHFDQPGMLQSITFRLADSLPQQKLKALERELSLLPPDSVAVVRRKRIEQWLGASMGCCALRHPAVAEVVEETLLKFDGDRYRLLAWCIMPNHVHVLIEVGDSLSRIVQSWKSFTGRWALQRNAELGLGVPGKTFWMRDYWDRYIRGPDHFQNVVAYIHRNPVDAGLCQTAKAWPWSSAAHVFGNGTRE